MSSDSSDGQDTTLDPPEGAEGRTSTPDAEQRKSSPKTLVGGSGSGAGASNKPDVTQPYGQAPSRGRTSGKSGTKTDPGGGLSAAGRTSPGTGPVVRMGGAIGRRLPDTKNVTTELPASAIEEVTDEVSVEEFAPPPHVPASSPPKRNPPPRPPGASTSPPVTKPSGAPPARRGPPLRDRSAEKREPPSDPAAASPTATPVPAPPPAFTPPPFTAPEAPAKPPSRPPPPMAPRTRKSQPPPASGDERARQTVVTAAVRQPLQVTAPDVRIRPLAEACEAELAREQDPIRQARLHYELGRASEDEAAALKRYRAALDKAPDHVPSLRAARAIHLRKKNIKGAAPLFDAEIRVAASARDKAMLLYEKGCAFLDLENDRDAARACFAEAASLDPTNGTVLKALEHVLLRAKDWAALAGTLAQEAASIVDHAGHRAAVLVERARLLDRRLRRTDDAIEQYGAAMQLVPYTPVALQERKRLLVAEGRWLELVAAFEREASLSSDPQVKALCYWSIARVQAERLGALAEGIQALEQAAELAPADGAILEELARMQEQIGNVPGTSSALERLASALQKPSERLGVLVRLADLHGRPGGDPHAAVRWYQEALAVDPAHAPALRALEGLYAKLQRWPDLVEMYLREASAPVESPRRAAAYARAAEVLDQHLTRPDDAAEHFAHALSLDPGHEGAFKALVRLHTRSGRHRELIELYDQAIERAKTEAIAFVYLFKIGAIYEDVLHDLPSAIDTYRRVLRRQPEHLGAIHAVQRASENAGKWRELVEALDAEAKLERDKDRQVALQHRAAEIVTERMNDVEGALVRFAALQKREGRHLPTLMSLGRLHRRLGRWDDVLAVHEAQLAGTTEPASKVTLLVDMGEIAERQLGQVERGIAYLRQALALDPQHGLARTALERLLRKKGDYKELAIVLEAQRDALAEPAASARTSVLLGEVYEVHLKVPDKAVLAYRRALDALPGYRPALDALARVHGQLGAWKELGEGLRLEARQTPDARMQLDARLRAATLLSDRLARNADAVTMLEEIVAEKPDAIAPLLALESLYVEEGNQDALAELYALESEVLEEPSARVAVLVGRARLLEKNGADDELRAACLSILAADRSHAWALGALERLALKTGDQNLLSEVDSRITEVGGDPALLAAHYLRLGDSLRGQSPAAALSAYRKALQHDADSLTAIRGLGQVAAALGDAGTMVEAYRREAAWTRDGRVAADLLTQAASVLARLGDMAGAIDDSTKALSQCPEHEAAARQVHELLRHAGQIDLLVDHLSRAAHGARSSERRAALWRDVGALYADPKRDVAAAIRAIERALAEQPKDLASITQLASLHVRDQRHVEAAQLYERALAIDPNLLEAHLDLARIYTKFQPDTKKARQSLDRLLEVDPGHREALCLLLQLHLDAGQNEAAQEVGERLLQAAGDDAATRAWVLVEIGKAELKVGAADRAADAFRRAVVAVGLEGDAAAQYKKLLGEKEPWEKYVAALREHLRAASGDTAARAAVYLEIARTENRRLKKPIDALRILEEGIRTCGESPALEVERADLLMQNGRWQEAVTSFQRLAAREPDQPDAWRGLVRSLQGLGRQGEAVLAATPLVVLGAATDVEKNLARERHLVPGNARPNCMARPVMRAMSAHGAEDDERVAAVLAAVADGLAKLHPPPYDVYGVRKGDRLKARSPHPIRADVDRLLGVFGVEEVDVYVHAGAGCDVAVELGAPPALMVPAFVADLPDAQRVFLLARPLAAIAAGIHPALKLGSEEMQLVIAAVLRRVVPGWEEGQHDEGRLVYVSQQLGPSWFGRGRFDEAAQAYYAQPVDVVRWCESAPLTASRAAAILAGDLDACVQALRATGVLTARDPAHQSPLVADLLKFWLADTAIEVRRLAGLI
jgi:tetratricopeptide (TPR) repeat protein